MKLVWISTFFLLFIPNLLHAGVKITEIMYDLPGTDSNREWIEVLNEGPDTVILSDWKFFENDTNHKIELVAGGEQLVAGGYAIIADDSNAFLADNPGFAGTLFKSSFSLNNSGELLEIRTNEGVPTDSVTYSGEWGADGNELSLQKNGTEWIAAHPTPGKENAREEVIIAETESDVSESTFSNSASTQSKKAKRAPKKYIEAEAGEDKIAFVGADISLYGEGYGFEGELLEGASFVWNFGDGDISHDQKTTHVFKHPGEYVVVLDVALDEYSASDRIRVKVLPADIVISDVVPGTDGYIEVENQTGVELDLSSWLLSMNGVHFRFPKNTIILPGKANKYPYASTGFFVTEGAFVKLLYPNGTAVTGYDWTSNADEETEEVTANLGIVSPNTRVEGESGGDNTAVQPLGEEPFEGEESVSGETGVLDKEDISNQAALTLGSVGGESNTGTNGYTILLLILLVGAGIGSIFFLKPEDRSDLALEELTPDDFEIIGD